MWPVFFETSGCETPAVAGLKSCFARTFFAGPEIISLSPRRLAEHAFEGNILEQLPTDVQAVTEAHPGVDEAAANLAAFSERECAAAPRDG